MDRPNIVFILIDDMGWMDLGCQGSSFYETPNLDRLAQQGLRFTNAYAAAPVCSPTRASIMAGKYPGRLRVTQYIGRDGRASLLGAPYVRQLEHSEKSLATAMREGGYATWHVGKWHLGDEDHWPLTHGFEVNIGGRSAGSPKRYFSPYENPALPDGPEGEYLTDRLTNEAINLIRNRDKRPFFLNLWHYAVHIPIQSPPHLVAKYKAKAAVLGLDKIDPLEKGDEFVVEHKRGRNITRRRIQSDPEYAAMVQNLDENIGRLLATLEEEGIADNTVVVFTSDNGGLSSAEGSPTCNAPLNEGKGWMYEGGNREPLIIRVPGMTEPDSFCHVPVTSPDFYPTLLELAGLPPRPQQHVDGVSIVPLLRGGQSLHRDAIFWHYPHYSNQGGRPACAVRAGRHKLIEFFEDSHVELYDLIDDVGETRNVANELPDVTQRLRQMLREWLADIDAQIPQSNPDWHG